MLKDWIKRFRDPEPEYRPHPFWSWNDRLEEEELREQVRLMAEKGNGGFYMHARDGLETPYLGDEWFRYIQACSDEAEKCGIEAWCYDENGWPSGSAGRTIPEISDRYAVRWIRLRVLEDSPAGEVLGYFAVRDDRSYRYLSDDPDEARALVLPGEKLMYVTQFTEETYIDTLNPEVVRKFIDVTYEEYLEKTGGALKDGKLFGFFTDEPQYALCRNPWSPVCRDEFIKRYGYDIVTNLPALFLGRDGYEKIRFDFWRMINDLFVTSYGKQINDWCREHSAGFTGHVMMEDNLLCQMHCTAGCMPFYEHMSQPGIDWLGKYPPSLGDDHPGIPAIPLQVGSVAAQLGKKHVLTETFALAGWNITFAEMKHLIEWQFLGGVNFVCQHLAPYSLRGTRKNDYPPAFFYQEPWWDHYDLFNDMISRTGKLLADGEDAPDVLVIHPIHSVYMKYTNDDMNREGDYDRKYIETATLLTELHVLYHFGDETIMGRHGSVNDGKLTVGRRSYSYVIMPNLLGLDRSTYELLMKFSSEGGKIVCTDGFPEYIDGCLCRKELSVLEEKVIKISTDEPWEMERVFRSEGLTDVTITGRHGNERYIHYTKRTYSDCDCTMYYFVNFENNSGESRVKITLPGRYITELDPSDMTFRRVRSHEEDGTLSFEAVFSDLASHIYFVSDSPLGADEKEDPEYFADLDISGPAREWRVSDKSDPNCALLDYGKIIYEDGKESDEKHVWSLSREIRKSRTGKEKILMTFSIDDGTDLSLMSDLTFVCEIRQPCTVTVNGHAVERADGKWWLDHAFSVYEAGSLIRHGENRIVISGMFREQKDGTFESTGEFGNMYLCGRFGVRFDEDFVHTDRRALTNSGSFSLCNMPEVIRADDIVPRGFPFFRGRLVLERDEEIRANGLPVRIGMTRPYAAYSRITVNGDPGRYLTWGSFRDFFRDSVRDGANRIEVELCIGNRNLLGPHHAEIPEKENDGPDDFSPFTKETWKRRYAFVKAGLGE